MSKNAEGWIRHRGGKCPVGDGAKVDYRMRNNRKGCGERAELLDWGRDEECPASDIMAYRLHKPAEQVEACSKPKVYSGTLHNLEIIGQGGPLQWRDRIAEIDSTTQALTTERAELVQKLASEGFALIGRINELLTEAAQKHEDMSDWRNWKVGDILLITSNKSGHQFQLGEQVRISSKSKPSAGGCGFSIEHLDGSDYWYVDSPDLEFHSRPSA